MWKIWMILLMTSSLAGCSLKPLSVKTERAHPSSVPVAQDESFDPATLHEASLIDVSADSTSESAPSEVLSPPSHSKSELPAANRSQESSGYRVQIIITNQETVARAIEKKAILEFEVNVYLLFELPNYKIRIGDCKTWAEADKLRETALEQGYPDALIIPSKIILTDR